MSDPAIEAVRRARLLGTCGDGPADFAEDAAREVLKPIQNLYRELQADMATEPSAGIRAGLATAIAGLAPLIFPGGEDD